MNLKRIFDFSLSLTGLVLSLPLWVIIIWAILIEDGRPIFYTQDRVGKGGVIFGCLKFRSMVRHADEKHGMLQSCGEKDVRYTKFGMILRATAMDELPQLINIIKGQMSFVGPRALRLMEQDVGDEVCRDIRQIEGFTERSSVVPGLTGIGQICLPHWVSRKERFKYDILYIKHQNIYLDLYIIFVSFLLTFRMGWEKERPKFDSLVKHGFIDGTE